MRIMLAIAILVALLLAYGLTATDEAAIEGHVLRLINEERLSQGTEPLLYDEQLSSIAREYSERMVKRDFFEHNEALARHDFFAKRPVGDLVETYGYAITENIVQTPLGLGGCLGFTDAQVARCMVEQWESSLPHRESMLDAQRRRTGIGVSCSLFTCKATQYFTAA